MSKYFKENQKTREQHVEDVLVELEKDLANFQPTVQKKYKTIQEYIRLLKLTKAKYQKLFEENKIQKEKNEAAENVKISKEKK